MRTKQRDSSNESGSIVVLVLFMMTILAAIPLAYRLVGLSRTTTNKVMSKDQSRDIARGGILDAIHWFRRQTVQPVAQIASAGVPYPDAAFAPDTTDTPKGGTIDPLVGLVKEYEFSPEKNIWARHEIRRQSINNQTNPTATDKYAAHDITPVRLSGATVGAGIVWSLVSRGIVFQRLSPTTPFDQPPNRILSESFAYSEIKRLVISPNVINNKGTIVTPRARDVQPRLFTTIEGNEAPAILTFDGSLFNKNSAVLLGTAEVQVIAPFAMASQDLLGVSPQELLVMSDLIIGTKRRPVYASSFTLDYASGDNSLFYVNGQLYAPDGVEVILKEASGILFLDGPVRLAGIFRGLIIINLGATVTLEGLSLAGAIFSNGTIISGVNTSAVPYINNLTFNSLAVQEAINNNNNYREVRSSFLLGADR